MKKNKELQSKGTQWSTLSSVALFFILVSVSFYLNKIIHPDEFGPALWAMFLIQAGFFFSHFSWFDILVREQKVVSKQQLSTGFYISALSNGFLFCFFFFGAKWISSFTQDFDASNYLRLYSFIYLLNLLAFIPLVQLTKEIAFKTISQINIAAKVISSLAAVALAIKGLPFYSLFCLYLGSQFLTNLFLFLKRSSLPNFSFDLDFFKKNLALSSTLTLQKFSSAIGDNLDSIVIGRNYAKAEIASYSKSYGLKSMPISSVARSITKVTFPTLSNTQTDETEFEEIYRDTQHFLAFILFPVFLLLFALAKPFAIAYFSEDWDIPLAVKLLRIFAVVGLLTAHYSHFESLFTIKGSVKRINQLTVLQRVIFITLLLFALPIGLIAVALAKLLSSLIDFILFSIYANQLFKGNFFNQLIDLLKPLLISISAGAVAYFCSEQLTTVPFLTFGLSALVFGLVYLGLAAVFDKKGMQLLRKNILNQS